VRVSPVGVTGPTPKTNMALTNLETRLLTALLNKARGASTPDDELISEWSFTVDPASRRWQVLPKRQALLRLYRRVGPAFDAVIGDTATPDDLIILEIYEKTAELRDRAQAVFSVRRPEPVQIGRAHA